MSGKKLIFVVCMIGYYLEFLIVDWNVKKIVVMFLSVWSCYGIVNKYRIFVERVYKSVINELNYVFR